MANQITKTVKGKYAGTCPSCNIPRGTWESQGTPCGHCGHIYKTEAIARTLDGEIKTEDTSKEAE